MLRLFGDIVPHVGFAKSVVIYRLRVLNADDEQCFAAAVAGGGQVSRDGIQNARCRVVPVVIDTLWRGTSEDGYGAVIRLKTAFNMQRLPWACFLFFGDAAGVFAGVPESGAVEFTGQRAADVGADEPHGAADCRVRAPALAEEIKPIVDV